MASKDKKQHEKKGDSFTSEMMHRFKTQPLLFGGTVVILVIVIVAFVFVPAIVPSAQGGGTELIFGYYNKVPIKYVPNNFFARVQQSLVQNEQLSPDDPDFMNKFTGIWRTAFEEAAIRTGIFDEMKKSGFMVPEDVIDRAMAELPHFQDNGRFSVAKYRAMDKSTLLNLRQQVEESIIIDTYLSDLKSLKVSTLETSFVSAMSTPKRSFDLAVFQISSFSDSDLLPFVETNPNRFQVMSLSRITIASSEREARQILDSIKNGTTTFEEAARNNSQDWAADRGGDIGWVMGFELEFEIIDEKERESVINLAAGGYSDLIKTNEGWVFFRANEAVRQPDLEDLTQMNKIRFYIMNYMRGQVEDLFIAEARQFADYVTEIGFDGAIDRMDLQKQSFGPIPVNYGDASLFATVSHSGVPELENAGSNQFFWRAAFSTPLNTPSNPVVVNDYVMVLYPTEEITVEEESDMEFFNTYYPYWTSYNADFDYRYYFINNEKFDDRFSETFKKIWGE